MTKERKPIRRRIRPRGNVNDESGLTIREADVKRAKAFKWLWHQRILSANLNMMMGEEGIGKGNLVAWISARVTRGELPGDLDGPHAVRFIGDEDSWDHIWTPRLYAAGADLALCVQVVKGTAGVFDVTREADIAALTTHVLDNDVTLLFFDQLLDNIGVTDTWRDKQVRDALAPLVQLSQATGCATLMNLHPNKRKGSFRERVSGTTAFNAVSRSSMLVAQHPQDDSRVVVVRGKGNYSEEPPGFEFRIVKTTVKGAEGKPVITSRIVDERENGLRSSDVLDGPGPGRREDSGIGRVRKVLTELMADGEAHPVTEITTALKTRGVAIESESDKRTIREASLHLKLVKQKRGFGEKGVWTWQML